MEQMPVLGKYQPYPEYKDSGVEWLGAVPTHWNVHGGKRIFSQRREPAFQNDVQLAASQAYGVVPQSLLMEMTGNKVMLALKGTDSFKHVSAHDFVISLRSFEGGIEHSSYTGCVSPAYTVLNAVKIVAPWFYRYLLKSSPYISALQASTDSLRDGKSITYEQFGAILLPLPALEEQRTIAAFLDYETARIDKLIAQQQRLIELLKEKRQAVISHAVTKGLNPDAPMKDSGVEWLGEVPEHWSVYRLRHLAKQMKAGPFGSTLTKDMYANSGYKVYGQEQVIPGDFSIGDYYISEAKYFELQQYAVKAGDILISCVGTFGKIAVFPKDAQEGIINPRLIKLSPVEGVIPEFLELVLRSQVVFEQMSLLSRGGTMDVVNIGILSDIRVTVPPLPEQMSLLDEVYRRLKAYDHLINKANNTVALLQELRTALISAAVTGKIDLRGWTQPCEVTA
ncbi:TPA: restriction endonuclease subunit S [Klebsiella pneumoniae]